MINQQKHNRFLGGHGMNESAKIPMWKKICYGCGAGGGNVMSTLLASFLLSYPPGTVC